jgi:hypothetical protein
MSVILKEIRFYVNQDHVRSGLTCLCKKELNKKFSNLEKASAYRDFEKDNFSLLYGFQDCVACMDTEYCYE